MTQNYQSADVWSRTKTINGYPVDAGLKGQYYD